MVTSGVPQVPYLPHGHAKGQAAQGPPRIGMCLHCLEIVLGPALPGKHVGIPHEADPAGRCTWRNQRWDLLLATCRAFGHLSRSLPLCPSIPAFAFTTQPHNHSCWPHYKPQTPKCSRSAPFFALMPTATPTCTGTHPHSHPKPPFTPSSLPRLHPEAFPQHTPILTP